MTISEFVSEDDGTMSDEDAELSSEEEEDDDDNDDTVTTADIYKKLEEADETLYRIRLEMARGFTYSLVFVTIVTLAAFLAAN